MPDKIFGTVTFKESVNLENFTNTGGTDLYLKLDGNFATNGINYEFRSIDGGLKWNYTVPSYANYYPYGIFETAGALYWLSPITSNLWNNCQIEMAEDSGAIALYKNGVLLKSATTLDGTLDNLFMDGYDSILSVDTTVTSGSVIVDCNVPILNTYDYPDAVTQWTQYPPIDEYPPRELVERISTNFLGGFIEDNTKQYYMYNTYASGVGTFNGFNKTGSNVVRNENIYAEDGHNLALYYTSSDNTLKLLANNNSIFQVYYSDGQQFVDSGTDIHFTEFYNYWQGRLGNTISASRVETNIPIFETMANANGYLNGTVDISQAINFDDLSGGINPTNKTALKDIATQFSDTYHTGVFGIQLACTISALRDIANAIYSQTPDLIEDIKKGLEMFGANPIDSIIDLSYYPFDVTQVVSGSVPQNYVNFGSYRCELSHSVNRIVYSNGYIDCGSVNFLPTYNNYMDYTHVGLEVYLPYIGMKQLDTNLYMGHQISVRYYIDFHTRGCTACILSDGLLCDYFEGQIGISQPITATSYSDYARTTIQTLVSSGSSVVGSGANVVGSYLGGNAMGMIGGVASGLSNAGATVYDVSTNNAKQFTKTKGNVGADTGGHMPQYVFFRFTYERPIEPTNLLQLYGKPSNKGGRISSFGGFLKCSTVDLDCGRATDSEKNEIISLLKSGIRI